MDRVYRWIGRLFEIVPDGLIPIVFGWPAIGLALVLVAAGIGRRRPGWVVAGAVAAVPFSLYLVGTPRFGLLALGFPLGLALAAVAVARRRRGWAVGLAAPFVLVAAWLAVAVAGQWWQSVIEWRQWRQSDGIDATPGQDLLDRSAPYPRP